MITFTASVMPEDKQAIRDVSFNGFIEKSIGYMESLNTISSISHAGFSSSNQILLNRWVIL